MTHPHFLIVCARFYDDLTDALVVGAEGALREAGASWNIVSVPGALEIPMAIKMAMESGKYDAYVALGCVIRGETYHFEVVCNESARGLTDLALNHGAVIGNGILTVENEKQAWVRADIKRGNKGAGAAQAALSLLSLRKQFEGMKR